MNTLTPAASIKDTIELLKIKRMTELEAIKEDIQNIKEQLTPANLIRSTFRGVTRSDDIAGNLGHAAVGLVTGYLTKKMLFRNSSNPIKKLIGVAFQTLITGVAANNSDKIMDKGKSLVKFVYDKISKKKVKENGNGMHDDSL